ncbi:FecR domain-containing protein [Pelomonas sp. P7]|uniref:FecR domain-containing protein n=1 Tax=Pelomonas caseinilytica TaxID=2906763 RepID=A0ABS8XC60_9BURK|nr:FecR domain-containing protein [Pelomonas sp. P7]MCE4538526.1 FecR domain-containing protein [Pelomonas sp. P7]
MTREILAEAAVWVTRLHGPDRSRTMQRECLAWQARSAAHRLAFERCTDTWQDVAGVRRTDIPASTSEDQVRSSEVGGKGWRLATAIAALGCAGAFALSLWPDGTYTTGVGEQRLIVLADGSRVTLNTSTDVRVKLTDALRTVTVARGEALFEVAKDAGRPFVVSVSDAKVVATGTAFLVRSTPPAKAGGDAFGVTLLEGQVIVQRSDAAVQSALSSAVVMTPGDRLRVGQAIGENGRAGPTGARLDRPQLNPLLAWKRGVAELDDVALADAVADMNRYSKVPIMLADSAALRALRVSGVFRTGDNQAFAQAVAKLLGLVVRTRDGGLELAGK